ncbi:hypothetical protein Bca52824_093800 [Brassica carinata]|uniref:non-specific serine/threonine protein kinase n=1 Tax=Brassica carinata TaxID=52824 RepID=A0A8X7P545_BRACI|nr:hypothetical protein Bca52824_093800 [Brassica carinata]
MFVKLLTVVFFVILLSKSSSQVLENFTYNGFHPPLNLISLQGIASVTSSGLLTLTNSTSHQTGHAFYTQPIRFKDTPNDAVSSFSTSFVFAIHSQIPTLGGDGIAFVVAPTSTLPSARSGQYLGLFNLMNNGNETNNIFAVELDTIQNNEFDDTNDNHVGIDINSLKSVKSSPAGYWDEKGRFKELTLISGKPMQVWVDYNGRTHQINVTIAPFNHDKPIKPLVSTVRDLSHVFLQDMFLVSVVPLIVFIFSIIFLVRFILRRRRKFAEKLEDWETEFRKNRLKFKDLYYATRGFSDLLGSGGFGSVYKGVMKKKEIAVKRVSNESRQGLKEFVSEIVTIGRMSHRNLVPLLGYCRRKNELLLVYEYMPNGSLDKYLYHSPEVTLDWKQRIKVILGVASALFYLHEDWEQVVIHRASDADYNGRLGDFGLARLCDHGIDHKTTHVAGTWGYLAPDHVRTGKATTATDVFAFGVLLLEVACGRRPIEIDNESGERALLVDWVFGFWNEGNILDAKDPNLGTEYDQREVEMVLKLGLLCSHSNPQARPTMRQVLHYLSGDAMLPDFSPLELHGNEMMLGTHHGIREMGMFTCGSLMVDSVLSGGR